MEVNQPTSEVISNPDEIKKQDFINENLIEKGYNVEELSAYILNRRGMRLELISFDILKEEIENFKDEKLKSMYKTVKNTVPKSRKEDQINDLYSSQSFHMKTTLQQECKLTELEKNKKKISIKISDLQFEKPKGFFAKNLLHSKYSCKLICEELGTEVVRKDEDFDWFKSQLNLRYPLVWVPPLPAKDRSEDNELKISQLNKFFDALLRKKILRTSPILQEFLELNDSHFVKYKDILNKRKFALSLSMENYKANKAEYNFDFKKEQIYLPEKYLKKIEPQKNIYNSINHTFSQIINDFSNLSKHMKELSASFHNLNKNAKDTDQPNVTKNAYDRLQNIFNAWSISFITQKDFFEKDFKEFFNYINMQLKEMNTVQKQYMEYRNNYEILGVELFNKRDRLFNEKKYNKWELTKEDEKNLDSFKDDYHEAIKYICKDYAKVVEQEKTQVACSCNLVLIEYQKVAKYIGEQLKKYLEGLNEKNQSIIADTYNFMKLFNIKVDI